MLNRIEQLWGIDHLPVRAVPADEKDFFCKGVFHISSYVDWIRRPDGRHCIIDLTPIVPGYIGYTRGAGPGLIHFE